MTGETGYIIIETRDTYETLFDNSNNKLCNDKLFNPKKSGTV